MRGRPDRQAMQPGAAFQMCHRHWRWHAGAVISPVLQRSWAPGGCWAGLGWGAARWAPKAAAQHCSRLLSWEAQGLTAGI